MTMDLVKLILDRLSPQLIGRIASALGLDSGAAQKAVGAAVPALLSGLVGLVSKPEGANRLATMLREQEPSQVDRIASMIGGSDQQAVIDQGTSTLSALFGNATVGSLAGALGRFAGTGEGQARSLLGMAAPIVMGVLGRQQQSAGLDAKGLANLLTSQKDTIAGAMPSGFASMLGGTGLLDGVADRLRDTQASAARAAQTGAAQVQTAARGATAAAAHHATAARRSSSSRWIWLVAAIVVLAALAYYWYGSRGVEQVAEPTEETAPTQPAPETAAPAVEPAQTLMVGDVDLSERVPTFFDNARQALEGVTDAASAEAALPKLEELATELNQITELAGQLPAEGKQALTGMVNAALPGIRELIDKVMAIPGVGEILKTAIEPIRAGLEALATA
jgi:hypothetical protein